MERTFLRLRVEELCRMEREGTQRSEMRIGIRTGREATGRREKHRR